MKPQDSYRVESRKLSEIRPDPNQPRRHFDEAALKELAETMKEHGLLKNIEVDPSGMIVTGERRYHAAMLAGWKEMPVRVVRPKDARERVKRQLVENLMHEPMNPIEIGETLKHLLQEQGGRHEDVARHIGKKRTYVTEHIQALTLPERIRSAIQSGKVAISSIRSAYSIRLLEDRGAFPYGTFDGLSDMIAEGRVFGRRNVETIVEALETHPGLASKILSQDFSGLSDEAVRVKIEAIEPSRRLQINKIRSVEAELLALVARIKQLVLAHPPETLGIRRNRIVRELASLAPFVERKLLK